MFKFEEKNEILNIDEIIKNNDTDENILTLDNKSDDQNYLNNDIKIDKGRGQSFDPDEN